MSIESTEFTLRKCMKKLIREKSFSKITVSEICKLSHISRRTFYRYYSDKYELFSDTYVKEYFNKLEIEDDMFIYDIYEQIINQMYEDKDFFSHAIVIKEQNGFWESLENIMLPFALRNLTNDAYIDEAKDFYVRRDIEVAISLIEDWINNGFKKTPKEFSEFVRMCDAVHGKWQYQSATKKPIDAYSFEKLQNYEW